MTNILLLIVITLFGLFFVWQIFKYCKSFKNRCVNTGINVGSTKTVSAIIKKAKEGKSFKLKDDQDEIKLIMLTKKNANSISRRSKRSR